MKAALITTCVGLSLADVPALHEMMDTAREIGFATFARRCHWHDVARALGYSVGARRDGGLRMASDWHVRWYRSKWNSRPCYVMKHSAIEYIFQEQTK